MTRVEIRPSQLSDISYVAANMRPADEVEIMCQLPETTKRHELAYYLLQSMEAHTAWLDGNPAASFGVSYMTPVCMSVWAIGTRRMRRTVPAITRFMTDLVGGKYIDLGFKTMEARSHVNHLEAHRWMVSTGAVQVDLPYIYGRNGEKFITFRWTAEGFTSISESSDIPYQHTASRDL